jgi:hypothetical protein
MNTPIQDLIQSQRLFFTEHITREIPFRLCALDRLQEGIRKYEPELTEALRNDLGKSAFESYASEIGLILREIKSAKKHLAGWSKEKKCPTPLFMAGSKSFVHPEPYGVVQIIAPWNYPVQLTLSPLIGAIAAGNCAIVKPSPDAPCTSDVLTRLIDECFESEYIAVTATDAHTTEMLLQERFDYIFYTGGVRFGKSVMEAAARHLTPVTLELGGKSPCIVDDDADLPVAARRIVWGKLLNCGQTCVAPDYLMVHSTIKDRLIDAIRQEIARQYGEDPRLSPDYPRIVNRRHIDRLLPLLKDGDIVCGGTADPDERYIAPTLIENVRPGSPLLTDEIFGPILPVIPFDDIDDCVEYINTHEKPLALYYFTQSKKRARYMIQHTSSGGVCINDTISHVVNSDLPFGGIGNSGIGQYHGRYSFETFSHPKSVVKTTTAFNIGLKFAPYAQKLRTLKKWL